jgi:putative transposase
VANVALTGEKNIRGRKRHILVDTEGNLLKVIVHRANMPDRDGARWVLEDADETFPRLEKLWVDQAYTGAVADELYESYQIILEIVAKPADHQGFVVIPRRWVVERTLAWLGRYRRLSKDYEQRPEYSESWVYIASIARMVRKLHPNENEERPYTRKIKNPFREIKLELCA